MTVAVFSAKTRYWRHFCHLSATMTGVVKEEDIKQGWGLMCTAGVNCVQSVAQTRRQNNLMRVSNDLLMEIF